MFKPSFSLPHSPCKHTLKFYCKNRHFSHVLWLPPECQTFTKIVWKPFHEIRVSKICDSRPWLTGKHHAYVRDWRENTTRMSVTDGNRMRQRCPSAMATPQHEPTSCQMDVVSSRQVSMLGRNLGLVPHKKSPVYMLATHKSKVTPRCAGIFSFYFTWKVLHVTEKYTAKWKKRMQSPYFRTEKCIDWLNKSHRSCV